MKKGDFVKINYIGKIKESGKVFDTTFKEVAEKEGMFNPKVKYGPVLTIVGYEKVVKGLDEELMKMKIGERKEVEVPPEKGFGKRNPKLIKLVPLSEFKKQNIDPYPGMNLEMNGLRCKIVSVNSGRVRVDFNHPLSGKTLVFDVKIEERIEGDKEKIEALCEYYNCKTGEVKINDKEVEIFIENDIDRNIKKMIIDDIFDFMNFEKIVFSQTFERKK